VIRVLPYTLSIILFVLWSGQLLAETIVTDSTTDSKVVSKIDSTTTVYSPPPSAISPSISASNSDLCTVGIAGAVQTQILGFSAGKTVRDMNCEKLKNAKVLYDMGMKVAAVSVMCGDERVFVAMMNAGTPCPFDGLVGLPAKEAWNNNEHLIPGHVPGKKESWDEDDKNTAKGAGVIGGLFVALLLLL
jgi:hypothetical protein|tara:strand:- start:23 stop:589 length:567 start_codon:yes stop_codon:yes gene_type:complete